MDDEQWAPVSDLMAVVMLVFMLITLILLTHFDLEKRSNAEQCEEIRNMLDLEFGDNFRDWGAELDEDLTIRFTSQVVLFAVATAIPSEWFADKIGKFFPRYMNIIANIDKKFGKDEVLAIRIEGHTSSEHKNSIGVEDAYIKNMQLSQDRAREILNMILSFPDAEDYNDIVRLRVRADGLSSSKLICADNGIEDRVSSRRVEFKLLAKSCQKAGVYDKVKQLSYTCPKEGFYDN